ncbi:MAG: type III polyketide synthase [Planctomycetaceae bacterium]|nr:type III polyketide synthase [Planctomycetaceae bacterium]
MSMQMLGLGVASPAHSVPQGMACDAMLERCCESDEQRSLMNQIYQRAGVNERGSVLLVAPPETEEAANGFFFTPRRDVEDKGPSTRARMEKYEEHALDLALESSRAAIERSGVDPSAITHLVTCSCSGFSAPGFDIGLIQELELSPETSRTHVGFMGCHGAFNALRAAHGYAASDPDAVVLVCSVELCSLHHHYGWSTEKVIANGLFADGSGAVVCRGSRRGAENSGGYSLIRNGSHLLDGTLRMMSWRIGDNGFEMTLSQKVPRIIEDKLAPWMSEFLAREGLTIDDIKGWAIHPGGPKILDACVTALNISPHEVDVSREVLANHGNMSSATVLFVLERLLQEPMEGPVVALGFGPGLTIEAMLLERYG